MKHRLVCFLLAALLLLSYMPLVHAEDYPNTYKPTGNQRQDLLGVAKTQVGYREGSGGYTKYGDWYGSPRMAWCGAFISWCANQAGIPQSVIKKNGFASASLFGLTNTFTIDDHLPQGGDLFFKNNGNHTGIVYYIEGDYFWTLEGNTWEGGGTDGVYSRKRSLYGEYYFASPNYQGESSSTKHTYVKGTEAAHPHREYYKCSDCGNLYYTGGKATLSGCKECQQENCSHSYGNYKTLDGSSHTATCTKCDKQSTMKHTWKDDKVLEEVSCENPGIKTQKCQQCGTTREVTIPQTNAHEYSDWTRLDEDTHTRKCQVCGREQEEAHKKSGWQSDIFEHWYECSVCDDRGGNEAHSHSDDCEAACSVCKYVSEEGHIYPHTWLRDLSYHWKLCINCPETTGKAEHIYTDDCDTTCDTCGFVRQVTHDFETAWESNSTGHWHRCTKCGQAEAAQFHVLGAAATESSAQVCRECGFEAVPAVAHVHSFSYELDSSWHWGSCSCGEVTGKEKHLWNMNTQACQVCGSSLPEFQDDSYLWFLLLAGVAVILLLIIVAIIIASVKRRMMRAAARAAFRAMEQEDADATETEEIQELQPV